KYEDKKLSLDIDNCKMDMGIIQLLKSLHSLHIRKKHSVCEDEFFELVKRRLRIVDLPVKITSDRFLLELVKTMDAHDGAQLVDFKVDTDVADLLLASIGFCRNSSRQIFDEIAESDFTRFRTVTH
ncbi:hypothetical protein PMAYCL1PPCAC_05658, partial [Pristionchus mayeri]